ncbi:propanediol utilization phosphotransacylase [Streptococcus ilei]|jgi:propanediol utilization protein pduL|uniref:ethanolamine utilization phosphate acetyltransferase EutD n=1 Tax=Streptococcus TaxID=1301 RepID=UPI0003B9339D|nr:MULTISPECIES: ethanolamine utilization phosphate acetyltransferase EutD [Streptococcus]AGY38332.1 propanediol utilization phosphotransacylase [Streptococcus ilei]MDB8644040.1 ethanolamine utilization phosphate acetyltransferase EutD [Streptococcus australis]MTS08350.1 phosphate propanoyltransferase [Streptococcus parasanguinis]RJU50967.1 phosphate propanoyltransferase [Streptococcus sp. AM28-20]VTY31000.1 Phosphate propanoyltransferase [Streptococcus parasanguinis]
MSLENLIDKVIDRIQNELDGSFEVEASGRHVHLSRKELDALFGTGYELTKAKDLSQPGQYASKERLTVVGPKGAYHNVVILGPVRKESQVEVSLTDCLQLGVKAPIRESGDIEGTPGIVLVNGDKSVSLDKGLIVAKRHVHMTPEDAEKLGVKNHDIVKVKVEGARPLIFDDVVIRVSPKFATYMHIDYDEANACGFSKGIRGRIIKD